MDEYARQQIAQYGRTALAASNLANKYNLAFNYCMWLIATIQTNTP